MSDFSKERLLGLDIVRASAILLVLLAHGLWVTSNPKHFLFLRFGGQFGVELFFVLSGFLIGTILLRLCDNGLNRKEIGYFWVRRWLRTVPAYFIVLLFIALAYNRFDPAYFVFLQGVLRPNFALLPVSWSLVIEEWFYLCFPLLCAAMLVLSPRRGFLLAALLLFSLPTLAHFSYLGTCGDEMARSCFDHSIRKSGIRFNTISMGAILAYINIRIDLKKLLQNHIKLLVYITISLLIMSVALTLDVVLHFPGQILPARLGLLLLYPLLGLCGVSIVTLFYVWQPLLPDWIARIITFISLTSYSNYLWHLLLRDALSVYLPRGWLLFVLYFVGSMALAGLSYWLTERPFLLLRRRLTKG